MTKEMHINGCKCDSFCGRCNYMNNHKMILITIVTFVRPNAADRKVCAAKEKMREGRCVLITRSFDAIPMPCMHIVPRTNHLQGKHASRFCDNFQLLTHHSRFIGVKYIPRSIVSICISRTSEGD